MEPEETTFNAPDTLVGDLRDWLLGRVRTLSKPWPQMSEGEQRDVIDAAQRAAQRVVEKAVGVIAANGFSSLPVNVTNFKVKSDLITGQFECFATDKALLGLHGAGRCVLVLADPDVFSGERSPAEPDPDESSLPIEGDD